MYFQYSPFAVANGINSWEEKHQNKSIRKIEEKTD